MRLARVAANRFNSVRYQPPPVETRQALYQKLTPDPDWYDNLKQEVAQLNAAAMQSVGTDPKARGRFLTPTFNASWNAYPEYDSVHLRQPIERTRIPIIRDAEILAEVQPGAKAVISPRPGDVPIITVDDTLSPGAQTMTLIHELSHNQLGHVADQIDLPRHIKEFQAEATARGVRERLGALSPNDQTLSAAYIGKHLTRLAGTGITPRQLFADNRDAIMNAVQALAPVPAQPFQQMVPRLYQDFSYKQ